LQIIFASPEEENFSCEAIRFEMPETADAKITWRDAQLCTVFVEGDEVGTNGWVCLNDYGAFDADSTTYGSSEEAVAEIIENMRDRGIYGATVDGNIFDERFDDAWLQIEECVRSIDDYKEITFSRNRLGNLIIPFGDARDRNIRLVLPKEGDEWRCYVGQRLVDEGDIGDLLEQNVRTEERASKFDW